jgi:hypothetical protein
LAIRNWEFPDSHFPIPDHARRALFMRCRRGILIGRRIVILVEFYHIMGIRGKDLGYSHLSGNDVRSEA